MISRARICAVTILLLFSGKAPALEAFLSVGIGQGGSDLKTVTGNQSYSLNAGAGFFFSGGIIFPVSATTPHRFESQIGLGYMFQTAGKEHSKDLVTFRRIPLDLIYYYHNTREFFRLGYGLTYHIQGEVDAKGINSSATTNVNNALGFVLSGEKFFALDGANYGLGLRYVVIDYSATKFTERVNGNSILLTMTILNR